MPELELGQGREQARLGGELGLETGGDLEGAGGLAVAADRAEREAAVEVRGAAERGLDAGRLQAVDRELVLVQLDEQASQSQPGAMTGITLLALRRPQTSSISSSLPRCAAARLV